MADDGVVLDDIAMDEAAPDADCNNMLHFKLKLVFSGRN